MLTYLPVATAVLGALLGGTVAYWLQRARPVVIVDGIRLAVEHSDDESSTRIDRSLIIELDQYERDLGLGAFGDKSSTTELSYVLALTRARLDLQDEIENYLPLVQESAQELHDHLADQNYDRAVRALARDSELLWPVVAVATRRGQFSFPDPVAGPSGPTPADDVSTRFHDILHEEDRLVIDVPGPFGIALHTNYGTRNANLEAVAERVAHAVAYRRPADLFVIVRSILTIVDDRLSRARDLRQRVAQELDPHRRLVVDGVLANAGRTSFSVFNRGHLVVASTGRGSRRQSRADTVAVPLRLAAASSRNRFRVGNRRDVDEADARDWTRTLDFFTPVLVPAGQSQRFICVSDSVIDDLDPSGELLRTFEAGERTSHLGLGSITNTRGQFKAVYSKDVLFGDAAHTMVLARRSSWSRRLLPFH